MSFVRVVAAPLAWLAARCFLPVPCENYSGVSRIGSDHERSCSVCIAVDIAQRCRKPRVATLVFGP
jgi:hypothetical protein